jgi:hypothetical protein
MADPSRASALSWEIAIPIATNPVVLANVALLFAITGLIVAALLAFVLAMTGSVASIQPALEWTAAATAGLFLVSLVVVMIMFGNRLPLRFRLDAVAAVAEMTDTRLKLAHQVTATLSRLAGRFGLAGAGLIAETSAEQTIAWNSVARAHFHPLLHTISLSNGWRTVLILFCTPQNYAAVAGAVHTGLAARQVHDFPNPLPRLLLFTFLVLLSSMALFALPYVEKDGVFPALVILFFALGAVWLEPRLAWIVLVGLSWTAVLEAIACAKPRESLFGGTYRAYQVLDMGDWITLGLAVAGAGFLIWLCAGLLRGRIRAGLAGEMLESGRPDG